MVGVSSYFDNMSYFRCKITIFSRYMQIFFTFCYQFAFNSRSTHVLLNLKKIKKPQKMATICLLQIKVVPLHRQNVSSYEKIDPLCGHIGHCSRFRGWCYLL